MSTTVTLDENENRLMESPGAQLALIRETRGYTLDYVATQLHLRVKLIELLEADAYDQLPQPVFIKGYIRAYSKLLMVAPEPFLKAFNAIKIDEGQTEKALWQNKRESKTADKLVRWVSGIIVLAVVAGISLWWQKNNESFLPAIEEAAQTTAAKEEAVQPVTSQLNPVSTLQSMFQALTPSHDVEKDSV